MSRSLAVLVALVVVAHAAPALGQSTVRRVRAGDVTGLEMGIDGELVATPGETLRWFVTLYEVVGRRELRPAAGATLSVTAAFAPSSELASVRTDALGRAALSVPIPSDLETASRLRVRAESPRGVERVFSVDLSLGARWEIELMTDRPTAAPGSEVMVFGRVTERLSGRPLSGVEVWLSATAAGTPLAPSIERETDPAGVFAARFPAGAAGAPMQIRAHTEHVAAALEVPVQTPPTSPLWIELTPRSRVVDPGATVPVSVRVRTPDGVAVEDARVSWEGRDDDPTARTDSEGMASLDLHLPVVLEQAWRDVSQSVRVTAPGHGSETASVIVRVARVPWVASASVVGGALVPELAGRVYARFVRADGTPLGDADVVLEAPRLGGALQARTDADGVAYVAAPVLGAYAPDACGGPTSAEATWVLGGHRQRLCLRVDPDAQVVLDQEGEGAFRVARRARISSAPVEVTALVPRDQGWVPVASSLVPAGETIARLSLPPRGEVWLRARPLLDCGRAVRGGSLLTWAGGHSAPFELAVNEEGAEITRGGVGTSAIFAQLDDGASEIGASHLERAIARSLGPVGAALTSGRGERWVAASLAARTPEDIAATAALREGAVIAQPMPESPVSHGLLRDPWRTQARFVRGRLGRMMRAVESLVRGTSSAELDRIARFERGRWRFNHYALDAALAQAGLGDELATTLDGEPLDVDALSAMDPAFDFDAVARRVTRQRLFGLHLLLRDLVRERGLDRPWARQGDPSLLLVNLLELEDQISWTNGWPERSQLFDAWGRPFVLRRARSRFTFLEPLPGWELQSAGPDGRHGTADDMVDPLARVLPSGGMYAEAVGEDILLARISGVALGRATLGELADIFEVDVSSSFEDEGEAGVVQGPRLPPPVPTSVSPRPLPPLERPIGGVGEDRTWALARGRRRYSVVALRFGADGSLGAARAELEAGAAWSARIDLPERLRVGDSLSVPLVLVQLAAGAPPPVNVRALGSAVEARLRGRLVVLEARRPGIVEVEVVVGDPAEPIETFRRRVRVLPEGSLRARHAGRRVAGEEPATPGVASLAAPVPEGARPWRSELVVGAPRALVGDPFFADARPALVAWARAMSDLPPDPALAVRLRRAAGPDGRGLERGSDLACAITAWIAADEDRAPVTHASALLVDRLGEDLGERAATLVALAPAAPASPDGRGDAVARVVSELRRDGWRALATATDRPDVMAKMAAALLLVDRDDGIGRVLLERALAAASLDAHGRRWVPDGAGRPSWAGTLAAAIAARQSGSDALADALSAAALTRPYFADRTDDGAFWALAASVYGAFGVEAPDEVVVVVDGARRTLALEAGVGLLSVRPGAEVQVESALPVWSRLETRYLVVPEAVDDAPLTLAIEGRVGRLGQRAGLELAVTNRSDETFEAPIVEVSLPSATDLDAAARRSLERVAIVRSVGEPDGAGVLRVALAPLPAGATHRLPLALRWRAAGASRGLALTAYDARSPAQTWSIPARMLRIPARPAPSETEVR